MRVLVAYASRYGATQGIAERIASTLIREGLEAQACPVAKSANPRDFDAVVIGSAAYFFHWMKEASRFVSANRATLVERPLWLFSSGPLGTKKLDAKGRDLVELCEPKEIKEFRSGLHPKDHKVLFGAMNSAKFSAFHRLIRLLPTNKVKDVFPEGDFRDWNEIDAWAGGIAAELHRIPNTR